MQNSLTGNSAGPAYKPAANNVRAFEIAVLLLPLLVLCSRDSVLYSPPLHTDPWFYLGYFRNLIDFQRDLAPGFHAGTRYSWILPGYLLHRIFPPVAANLILHLTVHSIATLSLFSILRAVCGARAAFLTAALFSFHPWLWAATGWDYVDGPGIAYCLLALALLTRAQSLPTPATFLYAGAALAAMLYTNLSWILVVPLLLAYHLATIWTRRSSATVSAAAASFAWITVGFCAITLIFCGVNYWLDGTFWFLRSEIATARNYGGSWRWPASIWESGRIGPWLWFSILASCSALALLPQRARPFAVRKHAAALVFSAQLLVALATLGYLQWRGPAALGQYFYASHLLPFIFLVIGTSFWQAADSLTERAYLAHCAGSVAAFAAIWYGAEEWPLSESLSLVIGGCLLAAALLLHQRKAGVALGIAGFAFFTGTMTSEAAGLHGSRPQYERVMDARAKIEKLRNHSPIWFWFDQHDPDVADFFALNSTYFAEARRFPSNFPQYGCEIKIDAGDLVVALSSASGDLAALASGPLRNCWRPFGIRPKYEEIDRYHPAGLPTYTIAGIRAVADPSLQHPLSPVFSSDGKADLRLVQNAGSAPLFPLERWRTVHYPRDSATVQFTASGIEVRTPRNPYAFALTYAPLSVPVTGRYRFALQFSHRSGQFAFGARTADDAKYLAADSVGRRIGDMREMVFWLDLTKGETILLRVSNNNNSGPGAASFLLEKLSAIEVDPVEPPELATVRK